MHSAMVNGPRVQRPRTYHHELPTQHILRRAAAACRPPTGRHRLLRGPCSSAACGATPGRVAVVGAGVIGLATALQLKSRFSHLEVDLIYDKPPSKTTSFGSGGYWEPYQIVGTPTDLINKWGEATFRHLDSIRRSPDAGRAGVQLMTSHTVYTSTEHTAPEWSHIVHCFRDMDAAALHKLGLPQMQLGWAFESVVADQRYYLPWLGEQVAAKGVRHHEQKLQSIDDLADGDYAVIFNCTGMGSRSLLLDNSCFPIRGQVRRVKAPWVKSVWLFDEKFYVIPNVDTVVVGGTQQRGNYNEDVDPADTERIWEAVTTLMPELRDVEIVEDWVGLRPGRELGVRLEREELQIGGKKVAVVHNYGHGGSGITLHWGCVMDAIATVEHQLDTAP